MQAFHHEVQALTRLNELDGNVLRGVFRRGMAQLAARSDDLSLPLEGVDPQALLDSVRHARSKGLFEDLSWLSASSAAAGLFELMNALPQGAERDWLGQMVVERVSVADAPTFATLALALVHGSRAGLTLPTIRARVALSIAAPLGLASRADALSLALAQHPDYAREWLEKPSLGALPGRRLAARLLERASREAVRRAAQRDDTGLCVLDSKPIHAVWQRLLADREPLVFRHVAVARGILCSARQSAFEELRREVEPDRTPTEWRRAAVSIAATIGDDPARGVALAQQMIASGIFAQDPGLASAMIFGLGRAAESQPQVAERILISLLRAGGLSAVEAFLELMGERPGEGFGRDAAGHAVAIVREHAGKSEVAHDDGNLGNIEWMLERLTGTGRESLDRWLGYALELFATRGPAEAFKAAQAAIARLEYLVEALASQDFDKREGRVTATKLLCEIEHGVLNGPLLPELATLGDEEQGARARVNEVFERLYAVIVAAEQAPLTNANVAHLAMHARRARAMLRMIDADGSVEDSESWMRVREARRARVTRVLLNRAMHDVETPLRRVLFAALARAFDALVREEIFELSDVFVCAALYLRDPDDINVLAEASMLPDLSGALFALSKLAAKTALSDSISARKDILNALKSVADALPVNSSPRASLLRRSIHRMHLSLGALYGARSLSALIDPGGGTTLDDLADPLQTLAQLVAGTRRRLSPKAQLGEVLSGVCVQQLGQAIEQATSARRLDSLKDPYEEIERCLEAEQPSAFYLAVVRVLASLKTLPFEAAPGAQAAAAKGKLNRVTSPGTEERGLPAWLPPNRLLGGFYVLHALGEGGVGSVFVARRAEEKDDENARIFALKVPEYNASVANVLSEVDFLRMFREEAGALLALPSDDPNLAGFVTFDAGVKPRPMLVMEHVEGPSLERLLTRRQTDVGQAFDILLGVAKGLAAMHRLGLAHLDLKPANVILRDFWSGGQLLPVLVDFGLAGRRLRPGCGTPSYAAPEIWSQEPSSEDPRPADVYALGCLAYELLTGAVLFEADSDADFQGLHAVHDGSPALIQAMHRDLSLRPLAEFFSRCLRHKPNLRASIHDVVRQLPFLKQEYGSRNWPVTPSQQAIRPARAQKG